MGGVLGSVLIGVFADINDVEASPELFGKQITAVVLVAAYSFVLSFGLPFRS